MRLSLIPLVLFLACFVAPAQADPARLKQAIETANWQEAMANYQATPLAQSIPLLRGMAERNVVMAQWFLADAMAIAGKGEEAARWLYSASLGTRMDAELCRMDEAKVVEYRFIRAFSARFQAVRANPAWRRSGLRAAVAFHRDRLQHSAHSEWVCQMVAREAQKVPRKPLKPQKQWEDARARVMEEYQHETGMDFSRSPDLFKINPAR